MQLAVWQLNLHELFICIAKLFEVDNITLVYIMKLKPNEILNVSTESFCFPLQAC